MAYTPLQLADAFIRAGELADALDALAQHLADHPEDEAARRLRIEVLQRQNPADALAEFEQLAALSAADYVRKSILLAALGRDSEALAAMTQAHALRPDDERIAERYFDMLVADGQLDAARDLLKGQPQSWRWLERAGDVEAESDSGRSAALYAAALENLEQQMDTDNNDFARSLRQLIEAKYTRAMSAS